MTNEETGTRENKERLTDWLKSIKRDPFTIMTLIVGSGFIGICFYFLGLYFLTVYLTGEQWNLRAIIFSPLPIDRLHAIGIGFILACITLSIAYLLIWQPLQAMTISKKNLRQTLLKNSLLVFVMSFFIALFTSGSSSALMVNIFLYPLLGVMFGLVVVSFLHMTINRKIAAITLGIYVITLIVAAILLQTLVLSELWVEWSLVTMPLLLPFMLYWIVVCLWKASPSSTVLSLQSQVKNGFQAWKKYDEKQKRMFLASIPALIMLGIFATIARTAHIVYTVGGDQWFGDPYQTVYVERAIHEETPVDTATFNEEGERIYRDKGIYIGQRGSLVTYINQDGDIIRRNDVVMIQEQPSNAQGSSNE